MIAEAHRAVVEKIVRFCHNVFQKRDYTGRRNIFEDVSKYGKPSRMRLEKQSGFTLAEFDEMVLWQRPLGDPRVVSRKEER